MDDLLDLIQWPAMLLSIGAAWLVGSTHRERRGVGFWVYLLSNAAWSAWAWHTGAYALLALQTCLAAMNVRGLRKAEST